MKKIGIGIAVVILVVIGGCQAAGDRVLERIMPKMVAEGLSAQPWDNLPDGLHISLCGAGSPIPDANRSGPCVIVMAGKKIFVVDVGSGSVRNFPALGVTPGYVNAVFLTHFHSDHIDGLGELATLRWAAGRNDRPLPVYGPTGVADVVKGFNTAYTHDFGYRIEHHGVETLIPAAKGMTAKTFAVPEEGEGRVLVDADGVKVTTFVVDHEPVSPAVGYLIEYKGRSVLISGDTDKSANLQKFAQGVDLLLHEALAEHLVMLMNEGAKTAGNKPMQKITMDILDYHASPVEAAEIARDAQVGHLMFYHIVPALPLKMMERSFVRGVSDVYDGDFTVGTDGSRVSLPANSDDIDVSVVKGF